MKVLCKHNMYEEKHYPFLALAGGGKLALTASSVPFVVSPKLRGRRAAQVSSPFARQKPSAWLWSVGKPEAGGVRCWLPWAAVTAAFSAGLRCCALVGSITAAGDAGAAAASPAQQARSRSVCPCPATSAEPVNQCQRSPEQILPLWRWGCKSRGGNNPNSLNPTALGLCQDPVQRR